MGHNPIASPEPGGPPSEGSPGGLKTDEQGELRSLRAPDILAQAPVLIRAPSSITAHFGADRAEIRPIGAITWGVSFTQQPEPQRPLRMACDTPYDVIY
jgi:hypothetical protein